MEPGGTSRLIRAGADPNADKTGVAPLHRAVRTRCAAAVEALLAGDAAPRDGNKSGSTPLHLAVQNTGRGNSGSPHAIEQQRRIIGLLLKAGATPEDKDENGKTVRDAATADWIRALFQAPAPGLQESPKAATIHDSWDHLRETPV